LIPEILAQKWAMGVEAHDIFSPKETGAEGRRNERWWHLLFGVVLPVMLQLALFLIYSLAWVDLMTGRRGFWDIADGMFLDLVIVLASMFGLPAMAIPFGVVQVFSALSLGKKGASRRKMFYIGLLNPSLAILAVTVTSVGWLIVRDQKEVIRGADWGVFGPPTQSLQE